MDNDKDFDNREIKSSRIPTGLLLLVIGFLLLAYKMGAPIPYWIFSWPMILIVIGLFIGVKSKFENPGAFIMILIGIVFLAERSILGLEFRNYIVPVILIGLGLIFILRPKKERWRKRKFKNTYNNTSERIPQTNNHSDDAASGDTVYESDKGEYINIQAVLGGVKRNIQSKNFKGGEILSFLGGSEINFMQADIQHPVTLEVNSVFGGTKLIIPSNWDVQNNISAVFGGVEDKRMLNNSIPDLNKKILLKGSCVFGGVEVTNY